MEIKSVHGVSYIGNPQNNTAMFVVKKVEYLVERLTNISGCVIFAEENIIFPSEVLAKNQIVFSKNPQYEYACFANQLIAASSAPKEYHLTEGRYYLGENVQIGIGAKIEAGALIGHNVVIGENAVICAGARIKNAIIGNDFFACENSVVGTVGYAFTKDMNENRFRIPTLGKVQIGDAVELGACSSISVGTAADTIIGSFTKIDANVRISHDCNVGENVEIAAGVTIGGYVSIEDNVFIGFGSSVKNRILIKHDAYVGMGANVLHNVEEKTVVVGNPARELRKVIE